jgi:hypothetical protein
VNPNNDRVLYCRKNVFEFVKKLAGGEMALSRMTCLRMVSETGLLLAGCETASVCSQTDSSGVGVEQPRISKIKEKKSKLGEVQVLFIPIFLKAGRVANIDLCADFHRARHVALALQSG